MFSNKRIAKDVYRMELYGDTTAVTAPGQFVNVAVEGCYLRRPLSVCDRQHDRLVLVYKTVGEGTKKLAQTPVWHSLDILTGLGNGYDLDRSGQTPLLIGGGVGIPPLYWLCKELVSRGRNVNVILGFNKASEIFLKQEFEALAKVTVTTVDGSAGMRGVVTDAMRGRAYSHFYACGPMPMLRAVNAAAKTSGQFSLEERMGCGFGACMGCTVMTLKGPKRVCKDGPVFLREELLW